MPKSRISNVANIRFNAIRENKILAKISEFTVVWKMRILSVTSVSPISDLEITQDLHTPNSSGDLVLRDSP